jgi:hypothetical protein
MRHAGVSNRVHRVAVSVSAANGSPQRIEKDVLL